MWLRACMQQAQQEQKHEHDVLWSATTQSTTHITAALAGLKMHSTSVHINVNMSRTEQ
jgi:hypothetical protein